MVLLRLALVNPVPAGFAGDSYEYEQVGVEKSIYPVGGKANHGQWSFLVPLIGGRWYSIPLIYHLYIAYWVIIMVPTTY